MRKYHFYYIYALVILALAALVQYSVISVWAGEERGSATIWLLVAVSLVFPVIAIGFCINFAVLGVWQADTENQRKQQTQSKPQQEVVPSSVTLHNHVPFEPSQPSWTDWVIVGLLVMITLGVYQKKR